MSILFLGCEGTNKCLMNQYPSVQSQKWAKENNLKIFPFQFTLVRNRVHQLCLTNSNLHLR